MIIIGNFVCLFYLIELKNTLESIINQNQVLSEVIKSVDSTCPDPFNEPEKFSVYFAQKSISANSLNDEFEENVMISKPVDDINVDESKVINVDGSKLINNESKSIDIDEGKYLDVENAILRLQNLRMEEQRGFQIERVNFESRICQFSLLQKEIELLRKQNSENEIKIEFLKSQTKNSEIEEKEEKEEEIFDELKKENDQIKFQLEEILKLQDEKELKFREILEENVRLKIEFDDLKRELNETRTQLIDLEVKKN